MKIQNTLLTISLVGVVLSACTSSCNNQESKKEIVIERVSFQKTPLDSVYSLIRPSVQSFNIEASETQKIIGENGTEVLIPANSFIDGFGKLVSGNVEIEIIEAAELTDFLTSNLQTLSNDNLLESAGMVFIDAKSKGKSLRIADGQKMSVSMPMMRTGEGFQMFIGKMDDGVLNWIEDQSADKKYLIPFPSDVLYTHYWNGWGGRYKAGYGHWNSSLDSVKFNPSNVDYDNTLIQTREFKNRMLKLYWATNLISVLMNKDLKREDYNKTKYDDRLFDLYFSNLDSDIQLLDSMANQIVSDFIDSPEFNEWQKSDRSKYDLYYYQYQWIDFDKENYKTLLDFGSDGAKGNVPKLKDYGVDLLSDNAYDELINKGANQEEALMMINFEQERSRYLTQIKREKELREKKEEMQNFVRETVFSTSELGWINCDRFLNDPTAGKAEITVTIESDGDLKYVDCSLVIPDLNVKLGAYAHGKSKYTFTKKGGIYTNLPIGKDALIIGVAFENDKCYFSHARIKIEDGTVVTLKMEQVDKTELKGKLENLLSLNA